MLASVEHPLANEAMIDLCDLSQDKLLLNKSSSWFRDALAQACAAAGLEPKILLDGGPVEMVRSFVEEGIGVALMENRIAQSISNSNTSIVPIRQLLERQSGLAVPRYTRLPLSTSLFRDFTLKEAQKFLISTEN